MQYFLLVLIFTFCFTQGITAQEDESPLQEGCDLPICETLKTDWEAFDYDTGCIISYECDRDKLQLYQLALAAELSAHCDPENLSCQNIAFLQSVAILVNDTRLKNFSWYLPDRDSFNQVFDSVVNGDFEEALTTLPPFAEYQSPFILQSRGLIYELLNQPDEALAQYDAALARDIHHLATIYKRGLLYGSLGRTVEASLAGAWLQDYLTAFAPDLLSMIDPLVNAYPLDKTRITDWVKYPVIQRAFSPGGYPEWDLTQTAPSPVQLSFYTDPDVIFAVDMSDLLYSRDEGDIVDSYILQRTESGSYVYQAEQYLEHAGSFRLQWKNDLLWGAESLVYGEGGVTIEFILAPADAPDPRSIFGKPACEGGAISRLRPGMRVWDGSMGYFSYAIEPGGKVDPMRYFDTGYRGDMTDPNTYPLLTIRVTENSVCVGSDLWWEITDGEGNFGWRAENNGNQYQLWGSEDEQG